MRLTTAPLLLAALLATAPAQTPTPATTPQSPAGMTPYHDDTLHLTYSYPASYVDASSVVSTAIQASLGDDATSTEAARCITTPLSRMQSSNGEVGILVLLHADAACLKRKFTAGSLNEFTQGDAQGLAASGAKTTFGQPIRFEVAAHPASMLRGSFTLPAGPSMQALVVCVLNQPDIVCWQFLASTPERINAMSAFPVSFDNGTATPLVPTNLMPKP